MQDSKGESGRHIQETCFKGLRVRSQVCMVSFTGFCPGQGQQCHSSIPHSQPHTHTQVSKAPACLSASVELSRVQHHPGTQIWGKWQYMSQVVSRRPPSIPARLGLFSQFGLAHTGLWTQGSTSKRGCGEELEARAPGGWPLCPRNWGLASSLLFQAFRDTLQQNPRFPPKAHRAVQHAEVVYNPEKQESQVT